MRLHLVGGVLAAGAEDGGLKLPKLLLLIASLYEAKVDLNVDLESRTCVVYKVL